MNSEEINQDTANDPRPLGYWLRVVDGLITREFAAAFDGEDISRRDWMLLNALSGDVELPGFAERIARKGKRLRNLADLGWVEESGDGTWTLTDEGRAAKERLSSIVDGIRSRVAGAVSPEDFATTMASLEAIARELGWDESEPMPGFGRGFGRDFGRGFGPGFGRSFGPGFGRGFGRGFRPDHFAGEGYGPHGTNPWHGRDARCSDGHGAHHHGAHSHDAHSHDGHHGRGRGDGSGRSSERAYERGFDAGFARGRSGDATTDAA
jgi:hypothetical protein